MGGRERRNNNKYVFPMIEFGRFLMIRLLFFLIAASSSSVSASTGVNGNPQCLTQDDPSVGEDRDPWNGHMYHTRW